MAAMLQAEAPGGAGDFPNPLFLVSGVIHVFRALAHLREAGSHVATENIDNPVTGLPWLQQKTPQHHRQDHPSRDARDQSQPPSVASSQPSSLLSPSSPSPNVQTSPAFKASDSTACATWSPGSGQSVGAHHGKHAASWTPAAHNNNKLEATSISSVAVTADVSAPPQTEAFSRHRSHQLDRSWEELAALYASVLAGQAMWSASAAASLASSSSSSSPSSSSLDSSDEASDSLAVAASSWPSRAGAPPCRQLAGPLLPPHHHHHYHAYHQQQRPADAQRIIPEHRRRRHVRLSVACQPGPPEHVCTGGSGPAPGQVSGQQPGAVRRADRDTAGGLSEHGGSSGGSGGCCGSTAAMGRGHTLSPAAQPMPTATPKPPVAMLAPRAGTGAQVAGEELRQADKQGARLTAVAAQRREADGSSESPPQWLQVATTLAGAVSRTTAQVAIHPLDTLKTRMQVRLPTPQLRVWRAVMSCAVTRPRALAAWAGVAGARDLMLGLGAAVAGVLPASALYFAAEPWIRERLAGALAADGESPVCRLAASAAAATLSALIRVPADVVKHRVQAYAYPSTARAMRSILASRGPAGLYAGFGATLLRDVPELVIQFTVYRRLKSLLEQQRRQHLDGHDGDATAGGGAAAAAGAAEHLFLGGAAGAAAALATTPLDVIKTQLQCGAATSVPAAATQVLRAGGPAALFGGLAPRLMQTTLCSALFFACFEASKARLKDLAAASVVATAAATAAAPVPSVAAVPPPAYAAAARGAAAAVKPPAKGWPLPLLRPQQQQRPSGRRRSQCCSGKTAAAAPAPAGMGPWEGSPWAIGGTLAPVALYAYAYAGAAAPVAAAAAMAAATMAASPLVHP